MSFIIHELNRHPLVASNITILVWEAIRDTKDIYHAKQQIEFRMVHYLHKF